MPAPRAYAHLHPTPVQTVSLPAASGLEMCWSEAARSLVPARLGAAMECISDTPDSLFRYAKTSSQTILRIYTLGQ